MARGESRISRFAMWKPIVALLLLLACWVGGYYVVKYIDNRPHEAVTSPEAQDNEKTFHSTATIKRRQAALADDFARIAQPLTPAASATPDQPCGPMPYDFPATCAIGIGEALKQINAVDDLHTTSAQILSQLVKDVATRTKAKNPNSDTTKALWNAVSQAPCLNVNGTNDLVTVEKCYNKAYLVNFVKADKLKSGSGVSYRTVVKGAIVGTGIFIVLWFAFVKTRRKKSI